MSPRRRLCSERGSATLYVLAAAALLLSAGLAAGLVGEAIVARHDAGVAADLGALAAAASAPLSEAAACAVAGRVVRANGAQLTTCSLLGADAVVTVQRAHSLPGLPGAMVGVASRAGPAEPPPATP